MLIEGRFVLCILCLLDIFVGVTASLSDRIIYIYCVRVCKSHIFYVHVWCCSF